uniref:Nuclear receptor subfamily 1, group I, member 2 n=1 Tax=Tetraodon nigroviridis TaxID=99883 RepID=H3D8U6_TETNG
KRGRRGRCAERRGGQGCGVCGDQARGYHFNAWTCEGCKGFFRRAIKRTVQLYCPFLNKCSITKKNRRQCQACRLRKCQAIGMRQEMVMSEEEIVERRIRLRRRKVLSAPVQLSSQQEETIRELVCSHRKTFDPAFYRFSGFRVRSGFSQPMDRNIFTVGDSSRSGDAPSAVGPLSPSCSSLPSVPPRGETQQSREGEEARRAGVFTALPHVTDLTTYMIHDIIAFSKSLTHFKSLLIGDQMALLKGATFEVMEIRFNMVFNTKTGVWECGHATYCIEDAVRAGFQPLLLEPLLRFHHTLRNLGLEEEEYVLMQAMSLFSPDRSGVQEHGVIDRIHENMALTLKTRIDSKRTGPEKRMLYPKVLACLTEMRTLTQEYSKQILQIQDIQPNVMPPLMVEMISRSPI